MEIRKIIFQKTGRNTLKDLVVQVSIINKNRELQGNYPYILCDILNLCPFP